ncbi:ras association domain-containing protein 8 [Pangasianodon hypophthalmus]|uniref:ras association domain-containing protein 8 n=1 Tax=Pangasianodon hypophthalmus TaxID=310915 RepID=UPI000EFF8B8C|nr:ras association domain-containing protein 8 [Pangasianodon hypophthalmus]
MEIKVSVDGVQRIVCGVTEMTTCQEVVIALAHALGRTGRYTLRENFKGYGRNVTPDEHLLESLGKYGQQAREVQLTLHYLGPSLVDWPNKPRVQLRRADGGGRLRRSSTGAILHRQSLPPLSHLHSKTPSEELKRPKRKSLTLMEEAWGWLENLGKGRKQQLTRDKRKNEENDGGYQQLDNMGTKSDKLVQASRVLQGRDKNRTENKKWKNREKDDEIELHECITEHKTQVGVSEHEGAFDTIENLKKLTIQQQASLRALKLKIDTTDEQIFKLEMQQAESMSDEEEQLEFWLNELKAEEGYEKVLQMQFLDLKEKATECKNKLEKYKVKLQRMNLTNMRDSQCDDDDDISVRMELDRSSGCLESATEEKTDTEVPEGDSKEKMVISGVESKLPYILVTANEISEAQLSSPSELREWWNRWTEAQKSTSGSTPKVVHRSEIIIHVRSTRV